MSISPEDAAKTLATLYGQEFGGKEKGRYKISRGDLAAISGRSILKQSIIDEIIEELADNHGLTMVDLGTEFPIIQTSILRKYRSVTSKIVSKYGAS